MDQSLYPNRVPDEPAALYLDLLKRCLTNWIYFEGEAHLLPKHALDIEKRRLGKDWPPLAHTMIGVERLENVQCCVETVLQDRIPGDLLEAGVWRGGASILMRAVLRAHGIRDRNVWVADSFAGLPAPNVDKYPQDANLTLHQYKILAVSLEQVQANFARYGLLDEQVRFVKGWFRDTLPAAAVEQIAVLRLDGDLYESTVDSLTHLYPKVSPGGFVIVDDYNCITACRQAVDAYREAQQITEPVQTIDWAGSYWRRAIPGAGTQSR